MGGSRHSLQPRGLYNISCAATAEMLPFVARAQLPLEEFLEVVSSGTGQRLGESPGISAGALFSEMSWGFNLSMFQEISRGFKRFRCDLQPEFGI